MTKKNIIISIIIVVVIGAAVVGALMLIEALSKPKDSATPALKPGDSIALADTPLLKTCEVLPVATIKEALGEAGQSLSEGKREGIVAHNLQPADACVYSFNETGSTAAGHVSIETYPYVNGDATKDTNIFDTTWQNIGAFNYPMYTLGYPTYYKKTSQDGTTVFALQVLSGPRHYRFALTQTSSEKLFSDEAAKKTLLDLAMKADYTVANPDDAPPAPEAAKNTPKPGAIEVPPLPELPLPDDANASPSDPVGDTRP